MIFTIPKGKHRAWPLRFGISKKKVLQYSITFLDSYALPGEDQYDTNKLFGCSYTLSPHKESARFGWYYNPAKKAMTISAYCYVKGERIIKEICDCALGVKYIMHFEKWSNRYYFRVSHASATVLGIQKVPHNNNRKWWYRLGLYFGGNRKAPNEIQVNIG